MKKFTSAIILFISFFNAQAVTKTWVGTTTNWSTSSNWSPSGIPGASDDVIFNNAKNCVLGTSPIVNSITLSSSYTGTFSVSGNRSLRILIGLTISGGTFNYGGGLASTLQIGDVGAPANFRVTSGGNFTSGKPLYMYGDITLNSGGNFTHTDKVLFGSSCSISGNITFKDILFDASNDADETFVILNTVIITGNLSFSNFDNSDGLGNINLSGGTINFQGTASPSPIDMTGFDSGGGILFANINSIFYLNGSIGQNLNIPSTLIFGGDILINNTFGVSQYVDITSSNVLNNISIIGGSFSNNGHQIGLAANKNFVVENGATFYITSLTGLPVVSGSGQLVFKQNSTVEYSGVNGQTIQAASYGNLNAGSSDRVLSSSAIITITGNYRSSPQTTAVTGSNILFAGNSAILSSFADVYNITVAGGSTLTGPNDPITGINIRGNQFLNLGTYNPNSGNVKLLNTSPVVIDGVNFYNLDATIGNPNVTYNNTVGIAGTWTPGTGSRTMNGTFNFNGIGAQSINAVAYKNLQTGGSGTKTFPSTGTITGNLTIGASTSLDISTISILGISGDITNNGTLISGSGTVNLNGTANQALAGIATYNNLSISKPTGGAVTITSGSNMQTINGFLTISSLNGSNKLNTNGNLTLASNASGTASLIDGNSTSGSGGSVNGNITVQRYHLGSTGSTHIFGQPITSSNVFTIGQGAYNVLLYSEDGLAPYPRVTNTYNGSYRRVTLGGTNLTVGRGYSIRKDAPGTLNFSGVPNNGNIGISATYTASGPPGDQGWNMLSNPYPSAINWATVGNTCGAATSGVSIWNGSTYTATAIIPSGVGFFIQATMNGAITFHNSDRIGSGTSNNAVYRNEQESKWFYLNVSNAGGGPMDAFAATFNNNATPGFESDYDITKPYVASGPFMYSRVNGKRLSLSVVPFPDVETKIPITLQVYANATYRFSTSSFADWYSDYAVFLKDSTSSGFQLIDLSKIAYYDFTKNTNDADTASRFSLIFKYQPGVNTITGPNTSTGGNPGTVTGTDFPALLLRGVPDDELFIEVTNTTPVVKEKDDEVSTKIYTLGSNLYIEFGINLAKSEVVVYDLLGRVVFELNGIESKGKRVIPMWQVDKSSVYIVKMRNNKEFITKRVVFN